MKFIKTKYDGYVNADHVERVYVVYHTNDGGADLYARTNSGQLLLLEEYENSNIAYDRLPCLILKLGEVV